MTLPSRIAFYAPSIGVEGKCIYLSGTLDRSRRAEPDFLYTMQKPVFHVGGIPYGASFSLTASPERTEFDAIKDGDVILSDVPWRWTGMLTPLDGSPSGYTSIYGEALVPYQVSGNGIGQFTLFGFVGESELAGILAKYKYTTDTGSEYIIRMDGSNGSAIGNPAVGESEVVSKPGPLTLRYVLLEQVSNPAIRRKIVICSTGNQFYRVGGNVNLETIAGTVAFRVTGRVGEKFSF